MRLARGNEARLATNKVQLARVVRTFNTRKRKNINQTFLCDSSSMQQNSMAKLMWMKMEEPLAKWFKRLIWIWPSTKRSSLQPFIWTNSRIIIMRWANTGTANHMVILHSLTNLNPTQTLSRLKNRRSTKTRRKVSISSNSFKSKTQRLHLIRHKLCKNRSIQYNEEERGTEAVQHPTVNPRIPCDAAYTTWIRINYVTLYTLCESILTTWRCIHCVNP